MDHKYMGRPMDIPRIHTRKVMMNRGNIVITKVSELINVDTREWDEELIRDIWQVDVQCILNNPLAMGMMEDFLSWHHNRTDILSLK